MLHPEPGGLAVGMASSPGAVHLASVARARPLDEAAIDALVRDAYGAYQPQLFGFLLRVTRDPAVAAAYQASAEASAAWTLALRNALRDGRKPPRGRAS